MMTITLIILTLILIALKKLIFNENYPYHFNIFNSLDERSNVNYL